MNLKILDPARQEIIAKVLPTKPLTDNLINVLLKKNQKILVETLKAELEIYRAYPKTGRMNKLEFDPTNHKKCFMGQAFRVKNFSYGDAYLSEYRRAIGTLKHGTWGDATLLEIWGGDHFKDYKDMVKAAFSYGRGTRESLPVLKFHVFPLFSNSRSGRWTLDDDDKDVFANEYMINLNGLLAQHNRKPMQWPLKDDWLKDFERSWEEKKSGFYL